MVVHYRSYQVLKYFIIILSSTDNNQVPPNDVQVYLLINKICKIKYYLLSI